MRVRLLLILLLATLAGCETIISPPPASQLYGLRPLPRQETGQRSVPVNLIVPRPTASPGLDREFIAVYKDHNQLSYFAKVRWTTSVPELVRFFIIDSLQNQGLFQSITPDPRFAQHNYRLDIHIQEFQADYASDGAAPYVNLKLAFSLTELASRKPLATFEERMHLPVAENRLALVVEAFQTGMERITRKALSQITTALANSRESQIPENPGSQPQSGLAE